MKLKKNEYMMEGTKFEQLTEINCREKKKFSFNPVHVSLSIGIIFNN